jgi:hypothetical protein
MKVSWAFLAVAVCFDFLAVTTLQKAGVSGLAFVLLRRG